VARFNQDWRSKLVLLLVLPFTAVGVVVHALTWWTQTPAVVLETLGLSGLLALVAWKLRTATPAAAVTGAIITASLMFSTYVYPYRPWNTALIPVLAVLFLTSFSTRFGRHNKERLGTAERRHGRGAPQVAANLGVAALLLEPTIQSRLIGSHMFSPPSSAPMLIFVLGLAALAEAAADTVSSEIGQVLGGQPRMITTLRRVDPGTDGGITLTGTLAGVTAAGVVAAAGCVALRGDIRLLGISWAGGVFGLFFDSLLGATLERAGWLNNDSVNFLSTGSAAGFALAIVAVFYAPGLTLL
jgi:uncharacterized protein (TIGR00297 family)